MTDSDAVHILQRHFRAGERETASHAEAVLRAHGGAGEGVDVEEDDDGGCGLEFLEEVDKDCRGAVRGASFIEEDTHATEAGDWRAA